MRGVWVVVVLVSVRLRMRVLAGGDAVRYLSVPNECILSKNLNTGH